MNSPTKDKVAVAILNWNGTHFLKQFLPDIIEHSIHDAHIYVIDNGSTDESVSYLKSNFPEINIIELKTNSGFTGGYNKGLEAIHEEYIVLLNSDIEVTRNWINPIIELMENDSSIAACQPKIKDQQRKAYFEYAGAAGGFIDKYGYPFCRGRIFSSLEKDEGQYDDTTEIFWATGACMFVRRNLFFEAGKLDDNFFAHMEEIDLCWRMKNRGYKIMYCGQSTIYHVGGGTLKKSNPHKTFLNFRNNLLTLKKNLPDSKVNSIILKRLLLDGIAGIKFCLQGNIKDMLAIIKAHNSFRSLAKQYNKSSSNNYPTQVLHSNIVFEYYLKGKKKYTDLIS